MSKKSHITADQVAHVAGLLASGMTQAAAARAAGVSEGTTYRIAKGLLTGRRVPSPKENSHAGVV